MVFRAMILDEIDVEPATVSDVFECEADKPVKPHDLVKFCVSSTCYMANDDDADRKSVRRNAYPFTVGRKIGRRLGRYRAMTA
ncbi:hypothetical protein [Rhizobium sp. BK602]|uniref:hypothetical protein n=1 Tax=Rhizobium sp. BK602 TaxID=2586986 RepID=UPI0016164A9A|nr:hypothetical protein [Rhizobium sp. BK602]MBB3610655.1 hypothetical protein [Rhizobium sp. BK602]